MTKTPPVNVDRLRALMNYSGAKMKHDTKRGHVETHAAAFIYANLAAAFGIPIEDPEIAQLVMDEKRVRSLNDGTAWELRDTP
jgi:hypothetical protein